jgi:DNA-directed RNA polymerase specialized sigma24 family protein
MSVSAEELYAFAAGQANEDEKRRIADELADPNSSASQFFLVLQDRSKNFLALDWAALYRGRRRKILPKVRVWIQEELRNLGGERESMSWDNRILTNELFSRWQTTTVHKEITPKQFFIAAAEAMRRELVHKAETQASNVVPDTPSEAPKETVNCFAETIRTMNAETSRWVLERQKKLDQLAKDDRTIYSIVMLEYAGRATKEIATLLGISDQDVTDGRDLGTIELDAI